MAKPWIYSVNRMNTGFPLIAPHAWKSTERHQNGSKIGTFWHQLALGSGKFLTLLEAQRRFVHPRSVRAYHASSDVEYATDILLRLHEDGWNGGKEYSYACEYLRARARNFVNDPLNWRLIEDLAKALLERRTLSGKEVAEGVKASLDAKTLRD